MKCILNLVPLILNDKSFKYEILSLTNDSIIIPNIELRPYQDIQETLQHIVSLYTTETVIPINYRLSDISIEDNVNIYYYALIPFSIPIKNAYLLPSTEYNVHLPNLQKILRSIS